MRKVRDGKIKKHDYVQLQVTHGIERAQVVRIGRRNNGALTLDRPDGRRIIAWMWDDGIAHLTAQPKCRDCGKPFRTVRGMDSHKPACPKKPPKETPTPPPFAPTPPKTAVLPPCTPPVTTDAGNWHMKVYLNPRPEEQQIQLDSEVKRLERALGEPIEAAERGPHRSFLMRGPGDLVGEWYLFIGAVWDERDGLQVILRRMEDKLCRVVHFSWLVPVQAAEPGVHHD